MSGLDFKAKSCLTQRVCIMDIWFTTECNTCLSLLGQHDSWASHAHTFSAKTVVKHLGSGVTMIEWTLWCDLGCLCLDWLLCEAPYAERVPKLSAKICHVPTPNTAKVLVYPSLKIKKWSFSVRTSDLQSDALPARRPERASFTI